MEPEGLLPHSQEPATCSYSEPDDSSSWPPPPNPTSWRSFLILSSHLMLGPTKTLYAPLLSPIHAACPEHLIILDLIFQIIFGDKYRSLSFSLYSFNQSPVPLSLRPKYSLQHLILKCPQPAFLPHFEWPSFTPIQNNIVLYILMLIYLGIKLEDKRFCTKW